MLAEALLELPIETPMIALSEDESNLLVRAGVAAPSADNHHVIEFRRAGSALRLAVRPGTVVHGAHRKAFHELAFGAVVENVALTASALRRGVRIRYGTPWIDPGIIADFEFDDAPDASVDPLQTAIFSRTTNRRLYARRKKATPETLADIARTATVGDEARVHWIETAADRTRLLRVVVSSERERFAHQALHRELFDAIRFDAGWNASVEQGLPPGALEVEAPFRPLFRLMRHWPVQRALNVVGASLLLGFRAAWLPAWTAPHLALISVPATGNEDWVAAGRTLQRFWLAAAMHALAFQPLAASVAIAFPASNAFGVDQRVSESIARELSSLVGGRRVVMIARIGFAAPPSIRAGRSSVSSYWK
jgi:hypothetical protein